MKQVKFGGYQHRYWLQQQREIAQKQEKFIEQPVREFESLLLSDSTLQVGRALAVVNHLQLSMTRQSQIIDEMSQRICEPDSADNVRRIDAILEKLQNLEEIVMKTR